MSGDLPAAHSMDTRWFAVDREGSVGVFDSGENGDVPDAWRLGQDGGYQWIDRLLSIELHLDLARFEEVPPGREPLRARGDRPSQDWELSFHLLVRASSPRLFDELPRIRPIGEGRFGYADHFEFDTLAPLLERGVIERVWCDAHPAVLLGAYLFEGGWSSYSRLSTPRDPLQAAALPSEIRGALVDLSAVSFRTEDEITPSSYLSCYSWGRY